METLLSKIAGFVLRAVLLLMGLLFLLSLLVVALVLLAAWGLRALWARLTGRAVPSPLAFTIIRRAQWSRFYGAPRGRAAQQGEEAIDVIDVEARPVPPAPGDRQGS